MSKSHSPRSAEGRDSVNSGPVARDRELLSKFHQSVEFTDPVDLRAPMSEMGSFTVALLC